MAREKVEASPGLRRWQGEALAIWLAEGSRGIAEVATGGGKTRFALACVSALSAIEPTTVVLVPTTALADQWIVSIAEDAKERRRGSESPPG
jgi:superfamily II DNA or RNA helicase